MPPPESGWDSAPEIFASALDLPVEERSAYLDEACGGHASLRAEVESLLHARGGAAFLGKPLHFDSSGQVLTELLGGAAAGAQVGPYRLLRLLATGGMGAVYLAERTDEAFRKQVAIKVIRPGLWSGEAVGRFRTERQVLADLEHPGIARLIDGGSTSGDLPYLVMEYVDGVPIDEFCETHGLDVAARLALFLEVCDAVQYAHQNFVIHRDLKPSNILVDRSGRPKLLDFGIAKVLGGAGAGLDLTATTEHRLTPRYASPEQLSGQRMTTATDVYSLGVVLYELLTGGFPYDLEAKAPSEILRSIAAEEAVPPSERATPAVARRLVGDLDTILLKALHKDPARRYSTPEEFAADIRRHSAGLPVLARPDTAAYRITKFTARHKALVGSVLAIVVVLAVALAMTTAAYRQAAARQQEAEWQAYVASLAAAESSLQSDQVAEATAHLDAAPAHLRSWEWGHLRARTDRSLTSFQAHPAGITRLAFLEGGERFVTSSVDSTVRVWKDRSGELERTFGPFDSEVESVAPIPGTLLVAVGLNSGRILLVDVESGGEEELRPKGSKWSLVSVSPDGSQLACGFFDGSVRVWDLAKRELISEWMAHNGIAVTAYSSDGRTLATGGGEGNVALHDTRSFAKLAVLRGHARRVYSLKFSPDGALLVSGSLDRTARVWDVRTQALVQTFREHRGTVNPIAFDPEGGRVATSGGEGRVVVWSLATGAVERVLRGHIQDCSVLAAHPDGRRLVSGDWGGLVKSWDWDTQDVRSLQTSTGWLVPAIQEAAWNGAGTNLVCASNTGWLSEWEVHDSRMYAYQCQANPVSVELTHDGAFALAGTDSGEVVVFRPADHVTLRTVICHQAPVLALAIDPSDEIVATASADSGVRLWRLPELELLHDLRGHGGAVEDVEFSPSGDLVASCGADGAVRLWEPASGRSLGVIDAGDVALQDIAFDPIGRKLAVGSLVGEIQVWDVASRRRVFTSHRVGSTLLAVAWSPDGTRIAAGGSDSVVRLFDAARGREVMSLHGHLAKVTSLRFGGGNAPLVSTSFDGSVRIWDGGAPDGSGLLRGD